MKKSSLLFCSSLLVLSLTACSNNKIQPTEGVGVGESILSTEMPTENTEKVTEEETKLDTAFTQEKSDKLDSYLSSYTYAEVTQSMENGYKDGTAYTRTSYDVKADTTSGVADYSVSQRTDSNTGGAKEGSAHYIRNYKEGITYEKDDSDNWIKSEGTVNMISWSLEDFTSTKDVFDYVLKDYKTPVDTKGYTSGNYEYYTVEEDANKDMVSGLTYDELGKQTVDYIYYTNGDEYYPVSVITKITYKYEGNDYYIQSTIQFVTFDNTSLNMPEEN